METDVLLGGRYRLQDRIGSGGMADVHRADDLVLDRPVAVKVMRGREATQADRDRFAGEARTVAGLSHPAIVSLLDSGLEEDRPYLVMELVDGTTLAHRLGESGPLPPEEVRRLGSSLASALAYAHARGVVHRDVKPGNVLLGRDGRICLADFGIARQIDGTVSLTLTGQVLGSPAYLAPEQVAAEPVGPRADVYSLGLLLFEALTGRRAFSGTGIEVAFARIHGAPEIPVSLGPEWVALLSAMTARDPAERPSAEEVVRRLSGAVPYDEAATAAIAVTGPPVARRRIGLLPAAVAAAAALVALMIAIPWLTADHGAEATTGDVPPTSTATTHAPAVHGTTAPAKALVSTPVHRPAPRPHHHAARPHRPAPHHAPRPPHHKPHPKPHHKPPGHHKPH